MAKLNKAFEAAAKYKASDLHIVPNEPLIVRHLGRLRKLSSGTMSADRCKALILELLDKQQRNQLLEDLQLDFALDVPDVARLRGSAMVHYKGMSATFRLIPHKVPSLQDVGMPPVVSKVLDNHQGLILVTGATGQGKSTTLAAMVDHLNSTRKCHILTVEDPIEFIHPLKRSVVTQRQVGTDSLSYDNALKGALRQDPDIIVIGELRNLETISLAMTAAETGHLVLGTLSTSTAAKTIDRILDAFPPAKQNQIRAMLAEALKAVITQRLIPQTDGRGLCLALEILIGTVPLANLIQEGKTFQIQSVMQTGKTLGMQMMDESILALLEAGSISAEDAMANAIKKERFAKYIQKEEREEETAENLQ
jgi:twitching motility protein PilT